MPAETRDDETTEIQWWTVVGFTETRQQCRVEHVATTSDDSEVAAAKACEKFSAENCLMVVAVFRGRLRDELASETAASWPLADDEESEDSCSS